MAACNDYKESQSAALCGKHALNTLLAGEKTIVGDGEITNMKNGNVDTVNLTAICKLKRDDFLKQRTGKKEVQDQYDHLMKISDEDFDAIVALLMNEGKNDKAYAAKLKDIRSKKNTTVFDCSDNNEYFSEDVLTLAIELLGYTWNQLTLLNDSEIPRFYEGLTTDLKDPKCIGAIVCKGGKKDKTRYGGWHWTTLKKGCKKPEKKDVYFYFDSIVNKFEEIQKNNLQTELEKKTPIGYISVFQRGGNAGPDMAAAGAAETSAKPVRLGAAASTPVPSEFTTVTLGSKSYSLPIDTLYGTYRTDLFTAYAPAETTLTHEQVLNGLHPDERVILRDTGFDEPSFLKRYAIDMPKFFEALPKCTTDTSVMLHRECDASYFLIFALLHQKAQEAAKPTGKPLTDLELLQKQAVLSSIRTKPKDQAIRNLVGKLIRIHTPGRGLGGVFGKPPTNTDKDILEFFTLYMK